jgi:hypothetical protein
MLRTIALLALAALGIIQFFRPERNNGNTGNASPNYIAKSVGLSPSTETILKTSCYDCHSNATVYPWYADVQPVAWWLDDHIKEGKKELNFDEFASYSLRKQYHKLEEVSEMVKEGEMPLASYTRIHQNAVLSDLQKNELATWSDQSRKEMEQKYPMDSLIRKK